MKSVSPESVVNRGEALKESPTKLTGGQMPATLNSIVAAATKEWEFWGKSTWNLRTNKMKKSSVDDDPYFAKYVRDNYCSVGGGAPSILDIQDDRYFWSAVGVSAMMKAAGFTKAEFPFAESHSVWIRKFIQARLSNDTTKTYWGYRVGEAGAAPEPGDLIAYARAPEGKTITLAKAAKYFDRVTAYPSHSDIVVAKREGEIDVIGANVLDSVTKKTIATNPSGHIVDDQHFWFAVLKRR
jgi:hypothetical protein